MSEYFDYHLQLIVREIPSYIKDTSNFLCKLKPITGVLENSYLVTLDKKSLYTCITNSEGIKAGKIFYENFTKKIIATKIVTIFLALILALNHLCSTQNIFYKPKVVQWELSVHHLTQIYS